jgi:hypothetical protein
MTVTGGVAVYVPVGSTMVSMELVAKMVLS